MTCSVNYPRILQHHAPHEMMRVIYLNMSDEVEKQGATQDEAYANQMVVGSMCVQYFCYC
jgi:hypothetical protein